ncbi:hypothetical protein [Wolbachia endosymbiont wVitB of Nasonia vitripennis phage WOVitB]|nr:hypothetical protein [Wolbachia endosymbiont wVitA of Nasonia vitripennis phage WOVitA1]ADW80208.1 hypothetical protein [Wolbachia endosymbiont wVitB of Nasonia vitripennis phage WOVitB]
MLRPFGKIKIFAKNSIVFKLLMFSCFIYTLRRDGFLKKG